jgi:PleD family two-component response regulator
VARAHGPDEAPEALFSRADAALYAAKGAGRDRVVLAA